MKQALVILNDELRRAKINYKFVANVHDEWQIEVEEARAEEAGKVLNMRCPLAGEYKVGNSWKETH
jgi:DNA polymerase I-like protein with 3'-5' exonuclease and polymerase domains